MDCPDERPFLLISPGRGAGAELRGRELPDYRPCEEALTRVGLEPGMPGEPVNLGPSERGLVGFLVPGVGFDCIKNWSIYL